MRTSRPVLLLLAWAAVACPPRAQGTATPPPAAESPARRDFRVHCAGCHGREGRGDGPLAGQLRVPPANLRTLAARRGGTFPETAVRGVLDGAGGGHGPSDMPDWQLSLQEPGRDAFDAGHVRERLDALVALLRAMQEEAAPPAAPAKRGRKRAR